MKKDKVVRTLEERIEFNKEYLEKLRAQIDTLTKQADNLEFNIQILELKKKKQDEKVPKEEKEPVEENQTF